jgi:hypothetical protein
MIAGQTRGDKQESKSRLRRRRVDRDSSFQLDLRCLRTPPLNLFHSRIFETALKMLGPRRWPETRALQSLRTRSNSRSSLFRADVGCSLWSWGMQNDRRSKEDQPMASRRGFWSDVCLCTRRSISSWKAPFDLLGPCSCDRICDLRSVASIQRPKFKLRHCPLSFTIVSAARRKVS